jgi:hypothetical protein
MYCFEVKDVLICGWRLLLKLERPPWRPRDENISIFDLKMNFFQLKIFTKFWSANPWIWIRVKSN